MVNFKNSPEARQYYEYRTFRPSVSTPQPESMDANRSVREKTVELQPAMHRTWCERTCILWVIGILLLSYHIYFFTISVGRRWQYFSLVETGTRLLRLNGLVYD